VVLSHAVTAQLLLLLLLKLFREILDLSALLDVVAPGVVHRAPRTALIGAEELLRSLVASWATAPPAIVAAAAAVGAPVSSLLLPPAFFFFLFLFFAVALSSGISFRLAGLPCLWGRLGMPCTPFYSPGAFVCQAEELRDVLHIVCG
jgi:hypothetical protein